jgi:dTDP-glucose 4,6-dehydratase
MDQRDLARWLEALLQGGRAGQAYNVGSDAALTIAELAHQVRDLLAPGKPVHIAAQDAGGPCSRYVPCIAKARAELGLDLHHTLHDAVLEAARHAEAAR